MTDTARTFIDDTMAKLGEWRPDVLGRYKVGRKRWNSQQSSPFIWWAYGSIDHDSAENHGWTDKEISTEEQTFQIKIWGEDSSNDEDANGDEEFVRVLKNDLLRALRFAADGPNLNIGNFTWLSEDDMRAGFCNAGAILVGTVIVKLPVKSDPSTVPTQFANITGVSVKVFADEEDDGADDPNDLDQTIVIPAP